MKKNLLTIILIFQIGLLSAQKTQSELIIGTWRFEKKCDLRTETEKSEFVVISCGPETENGTEYADRTFKKNNDFEFYYNLNEISCGKYNIENHKLTLENRLSENQIENNKERVESYLKKKLIIKKQDGFYYYRPVILELKSIIKNRLELGTEKHYTIWTRIK
ncbi:hypothetical protein [Aequorivita marina]|uniref:hypothetical protein n=1 Tax=Aequorivita marina TaxID=3073654 RepID=UPI00287653D9|nr:hypothetical protein [Aequorivita sp. S2608]MDS1298716.1 hypothetical protein [Aequorivita sp. S2608]